jgi:hypothetical protein
MIFFRFNIATGYGRIVEKPTVDSINTNAEWVFTCCEETAFRLYATVYTRQLGTQEGGGSHKVVAWLWRFAGRTRYVG